MKKYGQLFLILILTGILSLAYSNCGKINHENDVAESGETAHLTSDELQKSFLKELSSPLPADMCADSKSFSCDHRRYSTTVKNDQIRFQFECVEVEQGVSLCPKGLYIEIDSSSLAQSCRGEECDDVNESSDFLCYLNLSNNKGIHPVFARSNRLDESLINVYRSCRNLVKSSQGESF
ncbi:MAG: hypothetical protein AABY64_05405 [Bdellovibrionota bacterium]